MTHAQSFRHGCYAKTEISLIRRQLDLDVVFAQKSQLVNTATRPRIENVARPHEPPTTFSGDNRWYRFVGVTGKNIGGCFDVDFQGMSHANSKTANHQGIGILSLSKVKVMKQYGDLVNCELGRSLSDG